MYFKLSSDNSLFCSYIDYILVLLIAGLQMPAGNVFGFIFRFVSPHMCVSGKPLMNYGTKFVESRSRYSEIVGSYIDLSMLRKKM